MDKKLEEFFSRSPLTLTNRLRFVTPHAPAAPNAPAAPHLPILGMIGKLDWKANPPNNRRNVAKLFYK